MRRVPLGVTALLVILGVGVGYGMHAAKEPRILAQASQIQGDGKYQDLQQKMGSIVQNDLEDYLRLKGLEEKYKKADEILSKIMLIFLADLGLKLSDRGTAYVQHPEQFRPEGVSRKVLASSPVLVPAKSAASIASPWRGAEAALPSLQPGDTDGFLKKTQISDFGSEIARSSGLKQADPRITGCFSGNMQVANTKTYQVKLEVAFADGLPLTAKTLIQLSENGKPFSTSSGSGAIRDLRNLGEASEAIIVQTGGSNPYYLQLYSTSDQSTLFGNVYQRSEEDMQKYEYQGTTTLDRRTCE